MTEPGRPVGYCSSPQPGAALGPLQGCQTCPRDTGTDVESVRTKLTTISAETAASLESVAATASAAEAEQQERATKFGERLEKCEAELSAKLEAAQAETSKELETIRSYVNDIAANAAQKAPPRRPQGDRSRRGRSGVL